MLIDIKIFCYNNYSEEKKFNLEASYLTSAFSQFLNNVEFNAGQFERIQFLLVDTINGKEKIESDWLLRKQVVFDFNNYWQVSIEERKRILLELIKNEMLILIKVHNWNEDKFISIFDNASKSKLVKEGYFDKSINFQNDLVRFYFFFELNEIKIYLSVSDKLNSIEHRYYVLSIWPHDIYIERLFGEINLINSNIIVKAEGCEFGFKFDLIEKKIDFFGALPKWVFT